MSTDKKILVVDDDEFMHCLYQEALSGSYQLLMAEHGADAVMIAATELPDLILLDVELPDLDGYEVCRRIRQADGCAAIPVIFVSGHDEINDRVRGYEAGGDDYVVKPVALPELLAKIGILLRLAEERCSLGSLASSASQTAMTAMTSMSEMGMLLQSLQGFNSCADHIALADAVLAALGMYDLQGVVQIRAASGILVRTSRGQASPLESAVISHMASMERIFQFNSRLAVNYPHISLMVEDMPLGDADRCGRLRDHLAVLSESAEVRVQAIDAEIAARQHNAVVVNVIERIVDTLGEIDAAQRRSHLATQLAIDAFAGHMEEGYISVALSEAQEDLMGKIFSTGVSKIISAQSVEIDMQDRLSSIISELKGIVVGGARRDGDIELPSVFRLPTRWHYAANSRSC